MNKIKLLLVFTILSAKLFSQLATPSNSLHEKYWYYRTRLTNDFLKVGGGFGESIPMAQRSLYPGTTGAGPDCLWGDELTLMGPYISVLATEHYLLAKNGQSTAKVDNELYYALNALNRLDYYAEGVFCTNCNGSLNPPVYGTNSLNGFMLKDDVYRDLVVDKYSHFNYYNQSSDANGRAIDQNNMFVTGVKGTGANAPANGYNNSVDHGFCTPGAVWVLDDQGLNINGSDYIGASSANPDNIGTVINQDGFISLLDGFRLVSKYVTSSPNYYFPYENTTTDLRTEALKIMDRIYNYFNGQQWNLRNPVSLDAIGNGHGGDAELLAYPISEACCHAKGSSIGTDGDYTIVIPFTDPVSCQYSDPTYNGDVLLSATPWNLTHNAAGFSVDNAEFISDLLATCDCGWDPDPITQAAQSVCNTVVGGVVGGVVCGFISIFSSTAGDDCSSGFQVLCNIIGADDPIRVNGSYEDLQPNVGHWGFYHAPLLYEALNGKVTNGTGLGYRSNWVPQAESIISLAPCQGPYNYGSGHNAGYYWSSGDLLNHPDRASGSPFSGNYNGLDYMLYYNLLKIVEPTGTTNGSFFDLSDRVIGGTVGCPTSAPCTVGAFETITFGDPSGSPTIVSPNTDIVFRAGKSTNAGPQTSNGFVNVHFGGSNSTGNIGIVIQPYDCSSPNAGHYQREIGNNSSGGDYGEMGSVNPTHNIPNTLSSPVVVINKNNINATTIPNGFTKNDAVAKQTQSITNVNRFTVFPNPNSGSFSIIIQLNDNETASYTITDVLGREVYKESDLKAENDNQVVKLITLPPDNKGMFYLKVLTSKGFSGVKNIIVQ